MSAASAAVLSVLPLGEEERRGFVREFGPDARFLDLQRLRRQSFRRLWSVLREERVGAAVVSASSDEIQEFGDYLVPLACLLPAARREIRTDGEAPRSIHAGNDLLGSAIRMFVAGWSGLLAMLRTWAEARAHLAARPKERRVPAQMTRCLYLKPGLNFGRPVGGSVTHVAGVANALVRRGCAVRLLASQPQAMLDPAVEQNVHRADFPLALLHELNQHQYRRRFAARALEEAQDSSPDFVYQRYALNDLSGARLKSRLDLPLVVEFNGSEVWVQRHWGKRLVFERAARSAERAALRAADLVVAVSEEVARQAVQADVDPRRILFVPNGVDAAEFDPRRFGPSDRAAARARFGVPTDALLYTFVGTFGEWHGTDVFADAIVSLLKDPAGFLSETRAHFLLVGDGPLGDSVRARLADAKARGAASFSGLIPHCESPAILAAADVLVAPHKPNADGSPFFGSPTKLFEYMAMGRTIVASDLDQIGDVLRGWSPGKEKPGSGADAVALLVEPGSAEALERGIRDAARMGPGARERLGERARASVLRHFTWDRNVDAVISRLASLDGGAT